MDENELKTAINAGIKTTLPGTCKTVSAIVKDQLTVDRKETLEFLGRTKGLLSSRTILIVHRLIARDAGKDFIFQLIKEAALKQSEPINLEAL